MPKVNILYFDYASKIKIGGGQISLMHLMKGVDKEIFNVIALAPVGDSILQEWHRNGINTETISVNDEIIAITRWTLSLGPFNVIKKTILLCPTIAQMIKLLKRNKIDIVHANGFTTFIISGMAAKFLGIPVIWHVRDILDSGKVRNFLAAVGNLLTTKIIVVSDAVGKMFSQDDKRHEKVIKIYNGVDIEAFNPNLNGDEVKLEFNLKSQPIVGTIGRLVELKGHEYLLEAVAEVVKIFPNAKFLIVGDGPMQDDLKTLVKMHSIQESVIFTGYRSDVANLMAAMDVIVLCSILPDSFPRSVIEAMAMGKPVIGTNIGGVPEAIDDGVTGLLVPPKDSQALAKAMITLLQDKPRAKQMGIAGRKRVEQFFSIDKNIRDTEKVYMELVNK